MVTKLFLEIRGRLQRRSILDTGEQLPASSSEAKEAAARKENTGSCDHCSCKKATFPSQKSGIRRMTHQGAILQSYNNELVKFLENLSMHREELNKQIKQAEEERKKIQDEIDILTKQLECVCESLTWKSGAQKELDQILAETEVAYAKILESCRMLLNVLKTETGNLDKIIAPKNNVTQDIQIFQQMQH